MQAPEAGFVLSAGCGPEPIDQLVERFGRHGPAVDLHLAADLAGAAWPPEIVSTVYRIVQEALTNVARHAPGARSVAVTVTQEPQRVTVEVTDDAPPVAVHLAQDCEDPHHPHPREARRPQQRGDRRLVLGNRISDPA